MCLIPCSLFRGARLVIKNVIHDFYLALSECFVTELSSLRAESARAVTGRRCPYNGKGEDFLTGQPDFFA